MSNEPGISRQRRCGDAPRGTGGVGGHDATVAKRIFTKGDSNVCQDHTLQGAQDGTRSSGLRSLIH